MNYDRMGKRAPFWVSIYANKVRPEFVRSASEDPPHLFISADGNAFNAVAIGQRVLM